MNISPPSPAEQTINDRRATELQRLITASKLQAMTPQKIKEVREEEENLEKRFAELELRKTMISKEASDLGIKTATTIDSAKQMVDTILALEEVKAALKRETQARVEAEAAKRTAEDSQRNAESRIADERRKREEAEKSLTDEQRKREEAEKSLTDEQRKREEAEKSLKEEQTRSASAEGLLRQEGIDSLAKEKKERKDLSEKHWQVLDRAKLLIANYRERVAKDGVVMKRLAAGEKLKR